MICMRARLCVCVRARTRVCVCVCLSVCESVCQREREREEGRNTFWEIMPICSITISVMWRNSKIKKSVFQGDQRKDLILYHLYFSTGIRHRTWRAPVGFKHDRARTPQSGWPFLARLCVLTGGDQFSRIPSDEIINRGPVCILMQKDHISMSKILERVTGRRIVETWNKPACAALSQMAFSGERRLKFPMGHYSII